MEYDGSKKSTWTYDNGNKLGIFGYTTKNMIWVCSVKGRTPKSPNFNGENFQTNRWV
jgi:hypothetical protein